MKIKAILVSFFSLLVFLISIHLLPLSVCAEVFVYDMIALKNEEILLKVETRGKFSRKGGELVEFFADRKPIGKALSGGDGFAFKQFSSTKTGIFNITVKSKAYESTGLLVVLKKSEKIVFTELEGGLLEGELLKQRPKEGSQDAIGEINKRYPVIILQKGVLNKKMVKEWLKKHGYKELPVISWEDGYIFRELAEKGIKIKAVIGSNAIIDSAAKYKPLSFSFTDKEGSSTVKNWDEIKKLLLKK